MGDERADATEWILRFGEDSERASDVLFPLLYGELRRIASQRLRGERGAATLRTTELVHEAYLKLVDQDRARAESEAHFCAVASQAMRRILVDRARKRQSAKRGGDAQRRSLPDLAAPGLLSDQEELVALDDALTELAVLDGRQARVIELRYFGGLDVEEVAAVLGVSPGTVKRDGRIARAWLRQRLEDG